MQIVVSFATIPSRINHIEPVIQSILNQSITVNEIQIQIPQFCIKEASAYEIPSFLSQYEKVKVKVHDKDYGAANKFLYPILSLKENENTLLFVVDDDCAYPSDRIELLMRRFEKNKQQSYCFSGTVFPRTPQKLQHFTIAEKPVLNSITAIKDNLTDINLDSVQGFGMYLVFPFWFKDFDFSPFSLDVVRSMNDDTLISGLLECCQIQRIQVGPYNIPDILHQADINPIHGNGRLLNLTINGVNYFKKNFQIWPDVVCFKPHPIKKMAKKIFKKLGLIKS